MAEPTQPETRNQRLLRELKEDVEKEKNVFLGMTPDQRMLLYIVVGIALVVGGLLWAAF